MLYAHAVALAEARSYLAALADHADDVDASLEYERVLVELDALHGGVFPPTTEVPESEPAVLYRVAYHSMAGLAAHAVDPLGLELCLAMLVAAREADIRS